MNLETVCALAYLFIVAVTVAAYIVREEMKR